jgi:hypothetical protein
MHFNVVFEHFIEETFFCLLFYFYFWAVVEILRQIIGFLKNYR